MRVRLQYGRDGLDVSIDAPDVTLIEPRFVPGLVDEALLDTIEAFLEPIESVDGAVARELARLGQDVPVAVLPEGPQTIPYVG